MNLCFLTLAIAHTIPPNISSMNITNVSKYSHTHDELLQAEGVYASLWTI